MAERKIDTLVVRWYERAAQSPDVLDRWLPAAREQAHRHTLSISASVAGGETLDGDTLYGPAERPAEPYLAPRGRWLGLPPSAPAWCWFGPDYARLVRRHVATEPAAGGLCFTGDRWVPERLRARLDEIDPARRSAARRPRSPLRRRW